MTIIIRPAGLFLLLLTMPLSLPAQDQPGSDRLLANAHEFTQRYGLNDIYRSAVNDRGKGLAELQGLRNFRAVLPGVLYRAGGNNAYRKEPRPNDSPLPPESAGKPLPPRVHGGDLCLPAWLLTGDNLLPV